jgi:uncharacterized protein YcbK (DUF882 family)
MEGMPYSKRHCFNLGLFFRKAILLVPLGAFIIGFFAYPCPAESENKERSLKFFNTHTNEHVDVIYKQGDSFLPEALRKIDYIFRDHRSGEIRPIDPALLDFLYDLLTELDYDGEVHIISGYRSPKTNQKLREKSSGVAKGSMHMHGKALDFRLPGVDTATIRKTALAMKQGGVGYYKKLDFVQIDTGRVRSW